MVPIGRHVGDRGRECAEGRGAVMKWILLSLGGVAIIFVLWLAFADKERIVRSRADYAKVDELITTARIMMKHHRYTPAREELLKAQKIDPANELVAGMIAKCDEFRAGGVDASPARIDQAPVEIPAQRPVKTGPAENSYEYWMSLAVKKSRSTLRSVGNAAVHDWQGAREVRA